MEWSDDRSLVTQAKSMVTSLDISALSPSKNILHGPVTALLIKYVLIIVCMSAGNVQLASLHLRPAVLQNYARMVLDPQVGFLLRAMRDYKQVKFPP